MPKVELIGGPYDGHIVTVPEIRADIDLNFPSVIRGELTLHPMYNVYTFDGLEKARYVGRHQRRPGEA